MKEINNQFLGVTDFHWKSDQPLLQFLLVLPTHTPHHHHNHHPDTAEPLDVGAGAQQSSHPPFGVGVCLGEGD